MSHQENNEDDWGVDPDEAEARKNKALDLQVSYWNFKGNSDVFSQAKGTDELSEITGAILKIEDQQKMWPPFPSSENGKKQAKILNKEGVKFPPKTLICERRNTLGKPYLNESIVSDTSEDGKKLVKFLRANGAGKDCASCRFCQPEEYDGDEVAPFCGALRRIYVLCMENGMPTDIKVIEAKSDKSIKAIDSFVASIDSNRPLMSYLSSASIKSFKSKSGTVFYSLKLQTLENLPKTLKEVVTKAKDRVSGSRTASSADGGSPSGMETMGGKAAAEDDLSVDQIPF
jgi:hypothetical protein